MSEQPAAIKLGAVLIAEVGSVTTRVMLFDVVEGEMRLMSQVEKPTSIEPPSADALVAIVAAAKQISEWTDRQLCRDDALIMPQNSERDGVNHLVVTTSAAGSLSVIVTAISSNISARSSINAIRSTYATILQVVTLDDFDRNQKIQATKYRDGEEILAEGTTTTDTTSWIERQVQAMLAHNPDVVVMAGGLEGGATAPLKRLAHIVALTTLRNTVDISGNYQQNKATHPVIFAGNSVARDTIHAVLANRANVIECANVRPSLEEEHLSAVRREIHRLYQEQILVKLPGYSSLQSMSSVPMSTVVSAVGVVTRFLSERYTRQVLTLDCGSSSSSGFFATAKHYDVAVMSPCGIGYGIMEVVKERGLKNIARWLPFSITAKDLMHRLLNKLVRPQLIPTSHKDVFLEHAVAREALVMVMDTLHEIHPGMQYDMVIGCGGVLAHVPHPGMAALILIDALQPTAQETSLALDLYLDTLGLVPACGAMATLEPDAAVTLFDRDILQNTPLATCVVALGEGRTGKVAVEAELIPLHGKPYTVSVRHGQIACLPLQPGNRAQLIVRPSANVRIGNNAPGVEVKSDVSAMSGSPLGIIIDARGRPLIMPDDATQRQALLWEWLAALGAVHGASPYLDVDPNAITTRKKAKQKDADLDDIMDLTGEISLVADTTVAPDVAAETATPDTPQGKKGKKEKTPRDKKVKTKKPPNGKKGTSVEDIPLPDASGDVVPKGSLKPGSRISLADLDLSKPTTPPTPSSSQTSGLDDSLASLRQTVTSPDDDKKKKRKTTTAKKGGGLFGKKK